MAVISMIRLTIVDISSYPYCGQKEKCLSTNSTTSPSRTIAVDEYWIGLSSQQKSVVVNRLRESGVLDSNEGWGDFHTLIIRLFYYPKRSIARLIKNERMRIGPSTHQIGVHIRCGGYLADMNENRAMVTPEILRTIPLKMKQLYNNSQNYFYISTDSTLAAQFITKSVHPIPVVSTNLYHRGHSTMGLTDNSSLIRSLIDLHLVSQSNSLLLTFSSLFSGMVRWMCNSSRIIFISTPYKEVNVGLWCMLQ